MMIFWIKSVVQRQVRVKGTKMGDYQWRWVRAGGAAQVRIENGEDVAHLAELDPKQWYAISMPTTGVRFDQRMLDLMDANHDGRISVVDATLLIGIMLQNLLQ